MVSLEKYNLRWNAFEANTRKTLKELRGGAEFVDVTVVAGDGQQVRANKLVLAGGSSFFHKILRENPHPHPLIYLKGVSYEHLMSILDFVYTGETNIDQEDLDQFLDTAKELNVKGLVENETSGEIFEKKTKSRSSIAGTEDHVTTNKTCPSSRVAHSRKVFTPRISKSTCLEFHDDNSVADHSNIPSGMEGRNEADNYDNVNLKNNIVLSDEYQNEKEQAILAGKNLNDIYDTELYKEEGENNSELYNEEMNHSNYDTGDTEASVCDVKNEESTHDWYGYGEENDDADELPDEEKNWKNILFSSGMKCYQCSFCSKAFTAADKLKRHIRVHTGEKPFQCLVCSRTFSRKDHLASHNRIHTDEKPVECLVCSKVFSRMDLLQEHSRIHTSEKRYQCKFCFKMFIKKSYLNAHMKTKKCSIKT